MQAAGKHPSQEKANCATSNTGTMLAACPFFPGWTVKSREELMRLARAATVTLRWLEQRVLSTSHILTKTREYSFSKRELIWFCYKKLPSTDLISAAVKYIQKESNPIVHSSPSQHRASLTSSCKFRAYSYLKTKSNKYWSIAVYQSFREEISKWKKALNSSENRNYTMKPFFFFFQEEIIRKIISSFKFNCDF